MLSANHINKVDIKKKEQYAIGIDLGGTKIGIALVSKTGFVKKYVKIPTESHKGKEVVINKIKQGIYNIIKDTKVGIENISGIGIGIPGQISPETGIVYFAPNLPGWERVSIRKILEEEFNLKVYAENDANAAAWGERLFGIAREFNEVICLTLGTGIGGGLILNGKIYHGRDSFAGEIGHIVVNKDGPKCNCGGYGCLETYSSVTGIRNRIRNKIKELKKINADLLSETDVDDTSLAEIFQRARAGDKMFADIVQDAIEYLGVIIVSLINTFNPEMIVMVGGMTNEGEKLLKPLKRIIFSRAIKSNLKELKITFGELGDYAGVMGSAALIWENDN